MAVKKLSLALGLGVALSVASKVQAGNGALDRDVFCKEPTMVERTIKEEEFDMKFNYERLVKEFLTHINATSIFISRMIDVMEKEAQRAGNNEFLFPALPLKVAVPLADNSGVYVIAAQTFRMCDMPDKYVEYMEKEMKTIEKLLSKLKEIMPEARNTDSMRVMERMNLEDYFVALFEHLYWHVQATNQITRKERLVDLGMPYLKPQEIEALNKLKNLLRQVQEYMSQEDVVRTITKIYLKRHARERDAADSLGGKFSTFSMGINVTLMQIDEAICEQTGRECSIAPHTTP